MISFNVAGLLREPSGAIRDAHLRDRYVTLGPDVASALIRETFLSVPDDLGLLIYSNLTKTTPGSAGGTDKYRTLMGVG